MIIRKLLELFNLKKMTSSMSDSEELRFLKILANKEKPYISYNRFASRYKARLVYRDFDIELEYDSIRDKYNIDVRDNNTFIAVYGYYIDFCHASPKCVEFLDKTYGLIEVIHKMISDRKTIESSPKFIEQMDQYRKQDELREIATEKKKREYLDHNSGNGNIHSSITQ